MINDTFSWTLYSETTKHADSKYWQQDIEDTIDVSWARFSNAQRIRGFASMRYINPRLI